MSQSISHIASNSRKDILQEIEELKVALDKLKDSASSQSSEQFGGLRDRFEQLWDDFRLSDRYSELAGKTRKAGEAAYEEAREHPLAAVFIGLGVVAVAGWLLTRR